MGLMLASGRNRRPPRKTPVIPDGALCESSVRDDESLGWGWRVLGLGPINGFPRLPEYDSFSSMVEGIMSGEFWLNDRQWARLEPLLPNKPRGVPRVDDRRVISGIIHVLQSGCRWRDAPAHYGPAKTLYNRHVRWGAKGVWRQVFEALAAAGGPPAQVLIDSTHVKAHRSAAGGKGGLTLKPSGPHAAAATPSSTRSPTGKAARSPSC